MEDRCYYDTERCEKPLWQCKTCKEWYCMFHFHLTALGNNVECVVCERERKDKEEGR